MSSEIFTYTKQISRSNYFSEEEFMNRIETIVKDHMKTSFLNILRLRIHFSDLKKQKS